MITAEADYLIRRGMQQLDLAQRAADRSIAVIHLELSSRYLERAQEIIDSARQPIRPRNVVSIG